MAIIPVPFETFEIESDLTPDEIVETLRREVPGSNFRCSECENGYHLEMKRKFDFNLRRVNPRVHLRIRPSSSGSSIEVKIRCGPFDGLFILGGATLLALTVIWAFFSFLFYGMDIRISLYAGLFLLFIYLFGTALFHMEADLARKFLLELFSPSGHES